MRLARDESSGIGLFRWAELCELLNGEDEEEDGCCGVASILSGCQAS